MSYRLYYQLEEEIDGMPRPDIERLKNKDEVIDHLMYLLSQFEPVLLQIDYPDGQKYHYNQDGGVV
tara:strand:- start:1756 stop:1953 length:198 start_codon:yes stop_codon:yes gene_type:complete